MRARESAASLCRFGLLRRRPSSVSLLSHGGMPPAEAEVRVAIRNALSVERAACQLRSWQLDTTGGRDHISQRAAWVHGDVTLMTSLMSEMRCRICVCDEA